MPYTENWEILPKQGFIPRSKASFLMRLFSVFIDIYRRNFMSWRIIYISAAEEMKLYLDNLKVLKDQQEILIPLSDIHTIMVDNVRTVVTGRLMNKLTEYHILLIFCNEKHMPNLFCLGLYSHYKVYGVLQNQLAWSPTIREEMWKKIIEIKILNQHSVLKYYKKESRVLQKMKEYSEGVLLKDSTNREGLAASLYFKELFGPDFVRERGSIDAFNSALNYGYIVLRACVARTIVSYGLHPAYGIGHHNQFNAFNLVDDCMEVFRPIIDFWVILTIKDSDYLSVEMKQNLVGRLNAKVQIGGQKQTVLNAIDLYIQSFIKAMNQKDPDMLVFPTDGIAL